MLENQFNVFMCTVVNLYVLLIKLKISFLPTISWKSVFYQQHLNHFSRQGESTMSAFKTFFFFSLLEGWGFRDNGYTLSFHAWLKQWSWKEKQRIIYRICMPVHIEYAWLHIGDGEPPWIFISLKLKPYCTGDEIKFNQICSVMK